MALVQANGLSKNFGEFKAVDDVSFSVERGEVAGFPRPKWCRQVHHDEDAHGLSAPRCRPGIDRRY